ncbi:hypothetical protein BGW39_006441 [Mortierella sp. 14UC]|nr:hypothetical protein BGW39_006441 [Mortierella sp. 14UC]
MKFISALVVLAPSMVALATADLLQINNPTQGTVWITDKPQRLSWTGNCASMGAAGVNVTVDLVTGDADALQYVATLGELDCSGSNTRIDVTIPEDIETGMYAIIVRTMPTEQTSYTNKFKINNPALPAEDVVAPTKSTAGPGPVSAAGKDADNAATGSLAVSSVMTVLAGAAAVSYQLL